MLSKAGEGQGKHVREVKDQSRFSTGVIILTAETPECLFCNQPCEAQG